jgi:hypothetical protein
MNSRLCFATLALGKPYRAMALDLASDLATHAPGHVLVVATDGVDDFKGRANVFAFAHQKTGYFHCVNDKRFPVIRALEEFAEEAVFIDADTRLNAKLPDTLAHDAFIKTMYSPILHEQANTWLTPQQRRAVLGAARSFGVDPKKTRFVMDNIFSVKRDGGREKIFFQVWNILTNLFDFEGVFVSEGYCMSIASQVVGWTPSDQGLEPIAHAGHHDEISNELSPRPSTLVRAWRRCAGWPAWMRHRQKLISSVAIPDNI